MPIKPIAPLVLASASPRRAELLGRIGVPFVLRPSGLSEEGVDHLSPPQQAQQLATHKVQSVWQPGEWALGADTVVALGNTVFNKPADALEHRRFLQALSGQAHTVYTAFSLVLPLGQTLTHIEAAQVRFRALQDWEIEWYIASGEGLDKAGGYGVQEKGMVLVQAIEGDFYTVMGLPVARLWEVLWHSGYWGQP